MGYNIRAGLVEENADVLSQIKTAVKDKKVIKYEPPRKDLYTWQWRLRRVLKATEVLRTEMGGEFAGLGELVSLKVDAKEGLLIVEPKGAKPGIKLKQVRTDEKDALQALESYSGKLFKLEFFPSPSFDEDELVQRAKEIGWNVISTAKQEIEEDDGVKLLYPAEKIERKLGFDVLD